MDSIKSIYPINKWDLNEIWFQLFNFGIFIDTNK